MFLKLKKLNITDVCTGHMVVFQGWGHSEKWEDIFGKLHFWKRSVMCQDLLKSRSKAKL